MFVDFVGAAPSVEFPSTARTRRDRVGPAPAGRHGRMTANEPDPPWSGDTPDDGDPASATDVVREPTPEAGGIRHSVATMEADD